MPVNRLVCGCVRLLLIHRFHTRQHSARAKVVTMQLIAASIYCAAITTIAKPIASPDSAEPAPASTTFTTSTPSNTGADV